MPGLIVDGSDVVAVYEATSEAAARARDGLGPTFIEAMVERYLPHTSDDDDRRYRTPEDLEEARKRDPLELLSGRLMAIGSLTAEIDDRFHADAKREVDDATDFAESAPYPGTDDFYDHVYGPSAEFSEESGVPSDRAGS